jgi:hypothetical protein
MACRVLAKTCAASLHPAVLPRTRLVDVGLTTRNRPAMQRVAVDATPAALTGARMLLPTTGLRTSAGGAGSRDDMATPPVPRALQAATAGLPASTGRSPGQAKRVADGASADEAAASAGASQLAAEQEGGPVSFKRQKLVGVSSAGVPVPAAADVEVAADGADMADAAAEVAGASGDGTGQQEQQQQGKLESPARHAMLYAETQLLDPFELAAASPAVGSKGPAVQAAGGAAAAAAAASPAGTAAVSGGASGGSDPSQGVQQRRRLSAALALPPTQALDLAGEFEEAEGELEQEQTADKEQGTAEERAVEGGTGLAGPTAVVEQPLAQEPIAEPQHIGAAQGRQPAPVVDAARVPGSAAAPASFPDAGPRRNGRAAKPGAAAVAADTVGETVRKCGELLRETQAVLFDEEGGASSRLATPQRAQAWLKDLEAMRQRTCVASLPRFTAPRFRPPPLLPLPPPCSCGWGGRGASLRLLSSPLPPAPHSCAWPLSLHPLQGDAAGGDRCGGRHGGGQVLHAERAAG